MKNVLIASMIAVLCLTNCEGKDPCPEESYEWNDFQGNLIDCIEMPEIPDYLSKEDVVLQVRHQSSFQDKIKDLQN